MHVSVTLLYWHGTKLPKHRVRLVQPRAGILLLKPDEGRGPFMARLLDEENRDQVPHLMHARVLECGARGMLIEGIDYRRKGRKDAHRDVQAWWCEAPPRLDPLGVATDMAKDFEERYGSMLQAQREMTVGTLYPPR